MNHKRRHTRLAASCSGFHEIGRDKQQAISSSKKRTRSVSSAIGISGQIFR